MELVAPAPSHPIRRCPLASLLQFPSTIERHLLARRGRAILNGFDPARRAERLAGEIIAVLCGSFLLGQIATSKPSPPLCRTCCRAPEAKTQTRRPWNGQGGTYELDRACCRAQLAAKEQRFLALIRAKGSPILRLDARTMPAPPDGSRLRWPLSASAPRSASYAMHPIRREEKAHPKASGQTA